MSLRSLFGKTYIVDIIEDLLRTGFYVCEGVYCEDEQYACSVLVEEGIAEWDCYAEQSLLNLIDNAQTKYLRRFISANEEHYYESRMD